MSNIHVHLYTTNECRPLAIAGADEASETVCERLCQQLNIAPACTLLFALRIRSSADFVPGNRSVLPNETYEFRLRYQIFSLTALKRMSKEAYDYFYQQVKCDLIAARIPGLEYPAFKEQVTGLCVTNMYIDMLEQNLSIDYLMANYQRYVPAKYVQKHSVFIRRRILKTLNTIRNKNHDSYYVKGAILESIKTMAPNYLVEWCDGTAPYLPEDELEAGGACPVKLEFSPYHPERPGLSIYYSYKKRWVLVAAIADIYAVYIDGDTVRFEKRDNPVGFEVRIVPRRTLESFVSCICGYYRLSVNWTMNVCEEFKSPHLARLTANKCHGPIGGQYAYVKLQKQNTCGAYVVRECERSYDVYYIDIIAKGTQPETFKLTNGYNGMWHLHGHDGVVQSFGTLTDLAKSIPTEAPRKLRLAPSLYDKTTTLLLCLPPNQLTVKKTLSENTEFEMRKQRTQILNTKDFRKYLHTAKITDDGITKEMKADWMLPDDKKLEVTLKVLQTEKKLGDFMYLADKWSGLFAPELVKMYGFTLSAPQTFVIESIKMGPLDVFLRTQQQPVQVGCLLDAAYALARALHYLQENEIVHGRIRCCKLQVVKFVSPNLLTVRLGDPGFQREFQQNDVPWIPVDRARCDGTQLNYKDEIWAFATTLWEIFARGRTPTVQYYLQCKRRLPQPLECPRDVYNIMLEGWDPNPERRFTPQQIFSRLIAARESCRNNYESMVSRSTTSINGSVHSHNTEHTNLSYTSYGNECVSASVSESSTNSGYSTFGSPLDASSATAIAAGIGTMSVSAHSTATAPLTFANGDASAAHNSASSGHNGGGSSSADTAHSDLCSTASSSGAISLMQTSSSEQKLLEFAQSAFELPDGGRIVLQGELGSGHYGAVFRAQMEDIDNVCTAVAVKTLIQTENVIGDFEREFKIMQRLNHPNIVRIIAFLDNPMSIVMEYVEHRSFLMYLNSRAPTLTAQMLLKFAQDIASGMKYLVSESIVHRDLAARNVLVDANECVKITDFGLAQMTDTNGYYTMQNQRNIPIKWYAPETLATNKYSHYSDVWSYGVTLFEMFSRGNQPDLRPGQELKLGELRDLLQQGERLKRPPLCPENVYADLMLPCWNLVPKLRPDFGRILEILKTFVAEFGEVI